MYYQNYEDYMRAVLGYPVNSNIYSRNDNYFMDQMNTSYISEKHIQEMYPQIYKTINPLVCTACDGISGELTEEMLENIVEEIYKKVELNNEIMVRINIENRDSEKNSKLNNVQNRADVSATNKNAISEDRQIRRNPLLRDLIRILVLNRIIGGFQPNRPPRPPFPGPGPRPPHGGPGGRPPFPPPGGMQPPRPRTLGANEYNNNYTNF